MHFNINHIRFNKSSLIKLHQNELLKKTSIKSCAKNKKKTHPQQTVTVKFENYTTI